MTQPKNPDRGYRLPEDPEPEGVVCIRAYIPDAPEYIAAFWGSYGYLGTWLAWQRDSSKGGQKAADLWKPLIERAREEYLCNDGECGVMDVRQNPNALCELQKKLDCSDWETFASLPLCVPKMRFLNGVLQQDTTGNGDWVDAGDPEAPYDDRTDGTYTPAWSEPPEGEDGACLAALNAIAFSRGLVTAYANLIDGGASLVTGLLYWFSSIQIIAAIANVIIELTAETQAVIEGFLGDWSDVAGYDYTSDILCIIRDAYEADGSMTGAGWASIGTAMQSEAEEHVNVYEQVAIKLASIVFFALGPVGMSRVANFAGISSGDCSECGEFSHYFDFLTGQHGWTGDGLDFPGAVWQSDGWHCISETNNKDQIFIRLSGFSAPSGCTITIHLSNGWGCPGGQAIAYYAPNATIPTGQYYVVSSTATEITDPAAPFGSIMTSLEVGMECTDHYTEEQGTIIGVTISGPGEDPFS